MSRYIDMEETHGDEDVRNASSVLSPRVSVPFLTALIVSVSSVQDHWREEGGIKPWEGATESSDKTPS